MDDPMLNSPRKSDKPDYSKRSQNSGSPLKPSDDGYYASLSNADRWKWHAHHYAFRRVYLDVPEAEQRTSPADPKGDWFHEDMVADETMRLLLQKTKQDGSAKRRDAERDPRNDPVVQEQRKAWVTYRGYLSWEHYLDALEAGREKIGAFLAWCDEKHPPPNRVGTFKRAVAP